MRITWSSLMTHQWEGEQSVKRMWQEGVWMDGIWWNDVWVEGMLWEDVCGVWVEGT